MMSIPSRGVGWGWLACDGLIFLWGGGERLACDG